MGSGVFDQDQDDLNHAHTLFILDEEVSGRAPSVPQTVQHFLHGEVLLSAYFPMPCPGGGSEGLQVSCPAEPVILLDTEHQRKKDPPPGCRNLRKADKLLCSFRPETAGSYYYEKVRYELNREPKAKIDICRSVNMNSGKADRPAD